MTADEGRSQGPLVGENILGGCMACTYLFCSAHDEKTIFIIPFVGSTGTVSAAGGWDWLGTCKEERRVCTCDAHQRFAAGCVGHRNRS